MLDLTNLRLAARTCQYMLSDNFGHARPLQNVGEIETLGLRLVTLVNEIDNLSNLELFKVMRTDREISSCVSGVISMGVGSMLNEFRGQ